MTRPKPETRADLADHVHGEVAAARPVNLDLVKSYASDMLKGPWQEGRTTLTSVTEAEAAWREAQSRLEQSPSSEWDQAYGAERQAWDAYVDACEAAGVCLALGCFAESEPYAHCPQHRAMEVQE